MGYSYAQTTRYPRGYPAIEAQRPAKENHMCRPTKCRTCSKTTWAGCGQHVEMVKMSVPSSDWCNGKHSAAQVEAAKAARGPGFFAKLFGRA